ncbi:general transcription factor 3C polypeptide 3-like [Temnothorax curvispinosus]|uniref:General transcription factor 3C polypeptide 3-like n=1 Tax=Temnothorax curvispinosus TaxID=300111 RepID=A0A6J1QIC3_9HYME|nr:general transcription factor 3C polypeptide 3-like [Temnothorax curvispinosus]
MECNASKGNISISVDVDVDVVKKTAMEVEREKSTADDSLAISKNSSSVAPVIIEELDESAISSMDMDINEFVEAEVLQIKEVTDVVPNRAFSPSCNYNKDIVDAEDQDTSLTADEEDRLTKQFLNGELTFSEYSSRMDQDIDLETIESDASRRTIGFDHVAVQKIMEPKPHKANNGRQKRKRRDLPLVLQRFMGEAILRYGKGEKELAAKMCLDIIRQVPSAAGPFRTLATIYERDQEKSLQFALIAAYLSPKNVDQWIRLAEKSEKSGDMKQAIMCYSKAIQASPKDISLYEERARLQKQIGDKKAYLRGYTKLIHQLEAEDCESIIKYAKEFAERTVQKYNNDELAAVEDIFTTIFTTFAKGSDHLTTLDEVNIMTDVLIALKQFERCLHILVKYTNIQIRYKKKEEGEKGTTANDPKSEKKEVRSNAKGKATLASSRNQNSDEIESCDVPDNVDVELKAKFLVILIEFNYISIVEKLLPKFCLRGNPEINGELFLDVAEALMGKKEFQCAMVLLDPLVKSSNFSLAAVWLRHAECWVGCNNLDKAIESYEAVRRLSPQHLGARLVLAKLYKKSEHYDKAIQVLYQDPESDTLDPDVLYQRTLLLFKVGRYEEYFSSGMLLFSRHCVNIRRKDELNALARPTGVRQRLDSLQLLRLSCGERLEDDNAPTFIANAKPSEKNEFLLFLQMCKLACKLNKYGFLQRLCFTALTSKRFKKRNSHIIFLCLISCIHNKDSFYGYNIVREFVRVCQRSNSWNLLNIIIQRAEDLRHNRFIMRLLGRDVFSYLHIMHANNCLVSGTYKYALNGYMSLFKVAPSALLALLIGVTQLQMACQKMSAKKNQLVIQALAFFKKYMQLRGKESQQETYYNMARAFHQIGLIPSAIHFYKLVLKEDPGDLVKQHANLLDLRKEAAFNLHLVYLQSENHLLARTCIENDITI